MCVCVSVCVFECARCVCVCVCVCECARGVCVCVPVRLRGVRFLVPLAQARYAEGFAAALLVFLHLAGAELLKAHWSYSTQRKLCYQSAATSHSSHSALSVGYLLFYS